MGLFGKLFKTAATVGGTAASVKIAERVQKNNPNGVKDVNNDGRVDYADYLIEAKRAAVQVFTEASPELKEAAQKKIEELKEKYPDAAESIENMIEQVKDTIDKK